MCHAASVYSPVVFMSHYVPPIKKGRRKSWKHTSHILPLHTSLVAMHCYYLQPLQLDVSGSSSIINRAQHIRTFVTHFLTPLSGITSTGPHMPLFFFFTSYQPELTLHPSSCTDVGRIPNFFLILSACQFWKGEAGQKIIGRTSHKSECGGSRCGCGGGCHWASPRPIWPLFSIEAISVVTITTIIHSYPCPCAHGSMSSDSLNFIDNNKLNYVFLMLMFLYQ